MQDGRRGSGCGSIRAVRGAEQQALVGQEAGLNNAWAAAQVPLSVALYETMSRTVRGTSSLHCSAVGEFSGEETVVYDTGTCSGWCSFPIVCEGGTSGDCTPDNYGPTETADGNIFTWAPQSGQYVRHWSSRGQNAGVHFMEIDVYGC